KGASKRGALRSPLPQGEVEWRSHSGEGFRSLVGPAPPHPRLRRDLSPVGRGEETPSPGGALMLAISDLHVAYGQSEVLHGLNVKVASNEIVAIMGRNGMGKTTLMKSLMGILPTKSGSVTMDGT